MSNQLLNLEQTLNHKIKQAKEEMQSSGYDQER